EHLLVLAGGLALELAVRAVKAGRGTGRQVGPVPDMGRLDTVEAYRQPAGLEIDGVHPAYPAAAVPDRLDDLLVAQPHALTVGQRPAQFDLHAVRRRTELPDPGDGATGGHTQGDGTDHQLGRGLGEPPTVGRDTRPLGSDPAVEDACRNDP